MDDDTSTRIRERNTIKSDSGSVLKKVLFIGIGTAIAAVLAIEILSPMARHTNEKRAQKQQSEQEQANTEKPEQPDISPAQSDAPAVSQPDAIQSAPAASSDEAKPADTARP